MKSKYTKMHSNGNDFLITEDSDQVAYTTLLADRKKSIGFDQLLLIENKRPYKIAVFNSDGSEAENCINGLRCIANLYNLKNQIISIKKNTFIVNKTTTGATVKGSLPESFMQSDYHVINFGNNHLARELPDIESVNLSELYQELKVSRKFTQIKNFNLSIYQDFEEHIGIRTYENGAGETLSCGSATISVAYVIAKETNQNKILFTSKGGPTKVYIGEDGIASEASTEIIEEGFLNG